jgi:hypothetical protein
MDSIIRESPDVTLPGRSKMRNLLRKDKHRIATEKPPFGPKSLPSGLIQKIFAVTFLR